MVVGKNMNVRQGEEQKSWFRSERFLQINSEWYFITRERKEEGPFSSKQAAEAELINFTHTNEPYMQVWLDSFFVHGFTQ